MNETTIIGIGSPFGADQTGWLVVDALKKLNHTTGTELRFVYEKTDRPGTRLLSLLKKTNRVVLIDAVDNKTKAGKLVLLDKSDLLSKQKEFSSHNLGVAETLQLGETLSLLPEHIIIIGVCVDINDGDTFDTKTIKRLSKDIMVTLEKELQTTPH